MRFFLFLSVFLVLASFVGFSLVWASGSLSPLQAPAPTGYTLSDIYYRLTEGTEATAGGHLFAPLAGPSVSFHTLSDIYEAIPTLDPNKFLMGVSYLGVEGNIPIADGLTLTASSSLQGELLVLSVPEGYYSGVDSVVLATSSAGFKAENIKEGVNIFGLLGSLKVYLFGDDDAGYVLGSAKSPGTALLNLWNGTRTDGGYPGGSQADSGVDDYNNAKQPANDRYVGSAGWTQCNSGPYHIVDNPGGNYCNTGDDGADAKDNSTNLIWSLPCNGAGCDIFSDASPMSYVWSTTTHPNNFSTKLNDYANVYQLCSSGDHNKSGWFIPTQKQLMQAYVNGSYGNLENAGLSRYYWSGTTVSGSVGGAWIVLLSHGLTYNTTKVSNLNFVRCVRSAP